MMDWKRKARKALRDYPKAKQRGDPTITDAVDTALAMQKEYYNGDDRLRMVDMVYFRQTHTLVGASVECGYSIETVKKWNLEVITAVYVGLLKGQGA